MELQPGSVTTGRLLPISPYILKRVMRSQFDWSEEPIVLGGMDQRIKVAHFRLCHSRKSFVVAYPGLRRWTLYTGREDAGSSPAAVTIILCRDLLCPVFPR